MLVPHKGHGLGYLINPQYIYIYIGGDYEISTDIMIVYRNIKDV